MMNDMLICSIRNTTRLYKKPPRIGDVIEAQNNHFLVIGIQSVDIEYSSKLNIHFICQNLNMDFSYQPKSAVGENLVEFEQRIKTGKEHILDKIKLGKLIVDKNGYSYQTVEFTDVTIDYTDVVVSFLARPIRPVGRKEAKAKLVNERKRKLNLSLI